jgi:hypothetical protein
MKTKEIMTTKRKTAIEPFPNCPALDGYHCQTNSLAKIYHHHGRPLSEEMLLGLGAGLGFMYWRMKGNPAAGMPDSVFIGGRGNTKDFFADVGRRTGVSISVATTASARKAEEAFLAKLARREPAMLFGDMGFLPWFELPAEYHFGGHTFTVCGYDGDKTALASDMDPKAAGLKKGFYAQITLDRLRLARGSKHKPFPPRHAALDFSFSRYRAPGKKEIGEAVRQTARAMLEPPIKNFGVKGIRHTARELPKWPEYFAERDLRLNLFQIYIYVEIGGTGGGSFRPMYARFLREAAGIAGDRRLQNAARSFEASGRLFTEIALLFKEADKVRDLPERLERAAANYERIAELEEQAFRELEKIGG